MYVRGCCVGMFACVDAYVDACHQCRKSLQVARFYCLLPLFIQLFSRHIPEPLQLRPTSLRCHQQVLVPRIKGIAVRSHHQRLGISPGYAHLQSVEFHISQWLLREIARKDVTTNLHRINDAALNHHVHNDCGCIEHIVTVS